jgi:hypothetical protein
VYEAVLTEGGPADVLEYVDGALLIDLWHDLVLPWDVLVRGDGRARGPRAPRQSFLGQASLASCPAQQL